MATPALLGAAVMQAGLGRLGIDVVTPLVQWLYARHRLLGATTAASEPAAAAAPAVEASLASSRATTT
jgi:hypothetical protein